MAFVIEVYGANNELEDVITLNSIAEVNEKAKLLDAEFKDYLIVDKIVTIDESVGEFLTENL